jgi:hypothetical protein
MEMDLLQMISQVGFPIGVASYTLIILNSTIQDNTKVLQELSFLVSDWCKKGEK